jgi:hypothetical protein
MKKTSFSLILITLILSAFKPFTGIEGTIFPAMQCEDYNGKKVNLPIDTKNKYTLLGMAFSNGAEDDLKTWITPIYNKFIAKPDEADAGAFDVYVDYDINLYFIPMFTGLNQLTSAQSKQKIKSNTNKELFPYLLFYEGSKTYKEELDFQKKDIPYFFILDKTGKIIYATSGKYDDKKLEKIIDIIEEN